MPTAPTRIQVRLLYGGTIFLSSFLLFLIQPIFAKLILPWFGGSAAVWTICLVFFQTMLLLGYLYAHVLARRVPSRYQIILHVGLLAAALLLLPVMPGSFWKPANGEDPTWRILGLLTAVLGLPYFLLSATNPLLQSWYPGAQPYRLFALSNAGALLALAAYPVWIEPRIPTRIQDICWSIAFAGFVAFCAMSAWMRARTGLSKSSADPLRGQQIIWIALAAGGSMLLLATTNQLTQNVAAVPFLWTLPLSIYLLTFILCFESTRWYRRGLFLRLLAIALGSVAYAVYDIQLSEAILVAVPILALGLFIGCMYCHGELNQRKPADGDLTSFYLMIALGGALGATVVGLLAPAIFSAVYELPLSLLLVAALAWWLNWRSGWPQRLLWAVVTLAIIVAVVAEFQGYHRGAVVMIRSFYGSLRVVDSSESGAQVRSLYHGTVKHGSQWLSPERRAMPTSYYGPPSGVGLALRNCCGGRKRVGVIGLGAGTLCAYGQPGDEFHFYEINPQVIALANSQFSYLRDTRAQVEVTPGDARLSLEREPSQRFDVLVVDAFSGDAIPVHLLTTEAFALYLRHLKPAGILAIHVSNQYLDLAPVVHQIASVYGYQALLIHTTRDEERLLSSATWVLATQNREFLERPEIADASHSIPPRSGLRLWTDDYSNLLQVVKWISIAGGGT